MSDLTVNANTTIVIKKNKGLTHALRDLVKENPNSILSDGKITAKEWNAVLDKLIDINNARKANNQKPIFTGGTDKSRAGWHSSFVVHPNQKIELTPQEMSALYGAMGVTLKETKKDEASNKASDAKDVEKTPVSKQDTTKIDQAKADTTKVQQPAANDSIKVAPVVQAKDTISPAAVDTTKVQQPSAKDSVEVKPAVTDTTEVKPAADEAVETSASVPKTQANSRYELSWKEIGNIGLKSGKNFVKNMFCDENGFSLKRTAATVGVIGGLALAAPAAAAVGASAGVVSAVAGLTKLAGLGLAAFMTYHGGKNAIEGGKKYYNSTTYEDAKANMEQAMDGAVEVAAAAPAFGLIKGGANKGRKIANNKAEAKPAAESKPTTEAKPAAETPKSEPVPEVTPELSVEVKPAAEAKPISEPAPTVEAPKAEPKPTTETKPALETPKVESKPAEAPKPETKPSEAKPAELEIIRTETGFKIERHRNADGNISKDVVFDANGKYSYTKEIQYTSEGTEAGYTFNWANGNKDVFKTGSNQGVRTTAEGKQFAIELKDNKITVLDEIKPSASEVKPNSEPAPAAEAPKAETKPAEAPKNEQTPEAPKAETKPTAGTPKTEPKPTENAAAEFNKAVRSEVKKNADGTEEYFFNKANKIVKNISRDKDGNITGQAVHEFNANGEKIKRSYKTENGNVFESFYEKGLETKKAVKWNDGRYDELTPIGENIYEGVRTYPDGIKVKIRNENYITTELGTVE